LNYPLRIGQKGSGLRSNPPNAAFSRLPYMKNFREIL
jgi:hypothetical protein